MIKVFGITFKADVYAIIITINTALTFLPAMIFEQFIYFYNDIKVQSKENAKDFFSASTNILILFEIMFVILLLIFNRSIITAFASNLDAVRFNLAVEANFINILSLLFIPLINLNTFLFNAEMKFSVPFIIKSVPPFITSIFFIWMIKTSSDNLLLVMYVTLAANFIAYIIQLILLKKLDFLQFKLILNHPQIVPFIKNSFTTRLGNNINNFFVPFITSNVLAGLPQGYASIYSYALKFVNMMQAVLTGPSATILQSKIAKFWSERKTEDIGIINRMFFRNSFMLVIPASVILYFIAPFVFKYLMKITIEDHQIIILQNLIILFSIWTFQKIFEAPYATIIFSSKSSLYIIINNSRNIVIIAVTLYLLSPVIGIYSLPTAFILGMIHNNITNYLKAKKELIKLTN